MKVEQVKINDLSYELVVTIDKADAQDKKKKALSEYRRKAEIRGFRKGMAPMSLIEKMHGVQALVEGVNQLISEGINNHIAENQLNILGEPLPNEAKQKEINWESDETYEFVFDIALSPKVEFTLDSNDKIVSYNVAVSQEAKQAYKSNMLKQFGKLENTDVVKEEDFIIADLEQGENKVEGTYVTLRQMAEEAKGQFLGKKAGESFEVNVNETFTNETDRAALLKVKKDELSTVEPMWKVTIKEVKTFVEAEQTQDLYDRMFGEGVVTDEAGFEAKIEERIAMEYKQEADFRFVLDAREYLLNKTNIELPEEFMKKWLFTINEGKFTMEDIEKDFALFCKDFRWQMIIQYIMREQKMEITREEVLAVAKQMAKYQFAMYGLNDVPQEQLDSYAEAILANEKEGRRIVEKTEQDKVIGWVKSVVTLDEKEISIEDLQAMNN
ncbi:MAG: hypothetical protein J6U83_03620 [Bacteroidales bacterium]|nr:hypothetical protein [Bacteroidales bacterium]